MIPTPEEICISFKQRRMWRNVIFAGDRRD